MVTWRWWWWTTASRDGTASLAEERGVRVLRRPRGAGPGSCTQRRRRRRTRQGACVHRCRLCAHTGLAGRRMQRPDPGRHRAGAHRAPPTSRAAGAHGACRGGDRAVRERQPGRAARRVRVRGRIPSGPRRSGGRTLRGRRLVRLDGGTRRRACGLLPRVPCPARGRTPRRPSVRRRAGSAALLPGPDGPAPKAS